MSYLFACASIFILYIEIYDIILRKRSAKLRKTKEALNDGTINRGFDLTDISESTPEMFSDLPERDIELGSELRHGEDLDNDSGDHFTSNQMAPESSQLGNVATIRQDSTMSMYALDSDLPDDVYDYITMHHSTATIATFDTNYFLKAGMLCKLKPKYKLVISPMY